MARSFAPRRAARPVWLRIVIALLVVGAVTIVAVAAVLALTMRAMHSPASPPPEAMVPASHNVTAYPPPPPLQQQIAQARAAARSGVQQRVQLDVRPDELAALIAETAARKGVTDLRLYFGNGTVAAQGTVTWQGQQFDATVRLRPSVFNGGLRLHLEEARLGRAAVPAPVLRVWQEQLDRALAATPPDLAQVWLEGLQVEPGRAVVQAVTVPHR